MHEQLQKNKSLLCSNCSNKLKVKFGKTKKNLNRMF